MADNEATTQSPFGTYADWIELFNTGNRSVDLGGMYLTDNPANLTWQFPAETMIEPNSFLLVWADGDTQLGPLHADFRLSANGETVALVADDGMTLIDFVQFDKQLRDVSYGRSPDGGSDWKYLTRPTAGKPNVENARADFSADWPVWLFIALALVACVLVVLFDRIHARNEK